VARVQHVELQVSQVKFVGVSALGREDIVVFTPKYFCM
jgi:hypothetical protein